MKRKYFIISKPYEEDEITYIFYNDFIKVNSIQGEREISKNGKCDNQIAMDLINSAARQGYILKEFNLM